MKSFALLSVALLAGAVTQSASAQENWMNRMYNFDATWAGYVFGGSTQVGGVAIDTLAAEEMMDWGIDSAVSSTDQMITGFRWVLQDTDGGTTHQFSLVAYSEDPNAADLPDVAGGPILSAGPFTSPTGTAGAGSAWIFNITGLSGAMPREKDVFVGIDLPPAVSASDILLMQFIDADIAHPSTIYSLPGQSYVTNVANGSHLGGIDAGTNMVGWHTLAGSQLIDVRIFGPGGHPITNSNETNNPATLNGPVTTPSTAFYPDVIGFNGANRTDGIGFLYQDDQFAATGGFVGIVLGTTVNPLNSSMAGGPFPISNVFRGQGNLCTDIITGTPASVLFFQPTSVGAMGEQYFQQTISVPISVVTTGVQAVWQGVTFDAVTNRVRSSGCVLQTL